MHAHRFVSDGKNLAPIDLVRTARSGIDPAYAPIIHVEMSPAAKERVVASRAIVDAIVERGRNRLRHHYRLRRIQRPRHPADELAQLQVNLVLSHCAGRWPRPARRSCARHDALPRPHPFARLFGY